MPREGIEPSRPLRPLVFETSAYTSSATLANSSGVEGDRTPDLLHAMQALSQTELQPLLKKKSIYHPGILLSKTGSSYLFVVVNCERMGVESAGMIS